MGRAGRRDRGGTESGKGILEVSSHHGKAECRLHIGETAPDGMAVATEMLQNAEATLEMASLPIVLCTAS